jgi:hypothetical protein
MNGLPNLIKPQKSKKPRVPQLSKIFKLPIPVLCRIFENMSIYHVIDSLSAVSKWIRHVVHRWITATVVIKFRKNLAVVAIDCFDVNGGRTRRPKFSITDTTVSFEPYRHARHPNPNLPPVIRNDYQLEEIAFFTLELDVADGYWDSCYEMPSNDPAVPPNAFNNYRIVSEEENKLILDVTCAFQGSQVSRKIFRPEIVLRLTWKFDVVFTPADHWTLEYIVLDFADLFTFSAPWL